MEGLDHRTLCLGEPDLMKVALHLLCLGHLANVVGSLVHPAPLLPSRGIDLSEGSPEAKATVTDGKLGRLRQPPLLEIEK